MVNGTVVDELLARTSSGGSTAWYLTDKLGSVRDLVSSSGTELDHIVYDSFGNIVSESNAANGDRFKFTGQEYDSITGQYYYRARYYNPATGRFDIQDPKGFSAHDPNLYRYVGNNPGNLVESDGHGATIGRARSRNDSEPQSAIARARPRTQADAAAAAWPDAARSDHHRHNSSVTSSDACSTDITLPRAISSV